MIFQYLQAKLQMFRNYLHRQLRKFLAVVEILKNSLFCLTIAYIVHDAAARKRPLKLTEHSKFNSLTNIVAEIDVDALKKMKKLKTNEAKNSQKIKNPSSTQNFLVLIKKVYCVKMWN